MNIVGQLLIDMVATVVGILIVLWLESLRRPALTMSVEKPPYRTGADAVLGRQPGTWLRVHVHNRNVPGWLSKVWNGEPALMCRGWITFHHQDGSRVYDREMAVRWSGTPEPKFVPVKQAEDGRIVAILSQVPETFDIPPGDWTSLDVVYRAEGEDDCWGWNNQSYGFNRKSPEWRLEKGRYIARIKVQTGGRSACDAFLIVNDVRYEDFRLEPVKADLKARLK